MEELNLRIHSLDEVAGKCISINEVPYVFQPTGKVRDGIQSFPLQNTKSGLSRFSAKLYVDTQEASNNMISNLKESSDFLLNAFKEVALHTEVYSIKGGILKLQEYHTLLPEAAYEKEWINKATVAFQNLHFPQAIDAYQKVLDKNPCHTDALINIALCYMNSDQYNLAHDSLRAALNVDGNIRQVYTHLFNLNIKYGYPEYAFASLEKTLSRWKYDISIRKQLLRQTIRHDFLQLFQSTLDFLSKELGLSEEEIITRLNLRLELNWAKQRQEEYQDHFGQAAEWQGQGEYKKAAELYLQAIKTSPNNAIGYFNYLLCRYHHGEEDLITELFYILERADSDIMRNYCSLLILLLSIRKEAYEIALQMTKWLAETIRYPWDLPAIPYYYNQYGQESMNTTYITGSLKQLLSKHSEDSISYLLDLYAQRTSQS